MLILMLSNHLPQPESEILPSWSFWPPHLYWAQKHMKVYENQTVPKKPLVETPPLQSCLARPCDLPSCAARVAMLSGFVLSPAAPAMCSSTLSRSSHAAGWMSPYISSVRIGAALISRDKGAGERLITCKKPSHALQLSCANCPQWTTHWAILA